MGLTLSLYGAVRGTVTMTDLERVGRLYQKRRRDLDATKSELAPLIREARKDGMTLRRIASLTGLSYARVYQIEKETTND